MNVNGSAYENTPTSIIHDVLAFTIGNTLLDTWKGVFQAAIPPLYLHTRVFVYIASYKNKQK